MKHRDTTATEFSDPLPQWWCVCHFRKLSACLCVVAFLWFIPSCATGRKTVHVGERYAVNTQRTLFFKYGPAQATGADFALYKGQRLTMLKRQFGYSQVTTDDGQTGYVATDDLIPAPDELKPAPTPSSLASVSRGNAANRSRSGSENTTNGASKRATRSEESQVPPPDLPKPSFSSPPPEVDFRY